MNLKLITLALAGVFSLPASAQTEIEWWHSMTAVNGEVVNDLAKNFNASQSKFKIVPTFKGAYDESFTAALAAHRADKAPHILQVFEVGTATMMASKGRANVPESSFISGECAMMTTSMLKHAPDARPGTITGVRPEHLDIGPSGWALKVEAVELLGDERLVYGRWQHGGGEVVVLRTDESHTVPGLGQTIHVQPRPGKIHWFDAASGQRKDTP